MRHHQFTKHPVAEGTVSNTEGNGAVDGLSKQVAILPSRGRSELNSMHELPSSRLKGGGVIFIHPPKPSPLVHVACLPD